MSNEMQESMINHICEKVRALRGNHVEINLQIIEIDGIDVAVHLVLGVNDDSTFITYSHLKIESSKIQEIREDCAEQKRLLTIPLKNHQQELKQQISSLLLQCKLNLESIKFSKLFGVFCSVDKIPLQTYSFCQAFNIEEETGIISKFGDCCICFDKTNTRTPCKHALCIPCWAKINYKEDDDLGDNVRDCPICRANIY